MKKIVMSHNFPVDQFADQLKDFAIVRPGRPLAEFARDEMTEAVREAEVLICIRDFICDRNLIEAGKDLKVIGNLGSGFNNVDVDAATEKGIAVLNTPTAVIEPTAEMTIALILAICRSIPRYDRELRKTRLCVPTLLLERDMRISGRTLGVLGFGRIGRSVAKKAAGLGMKILYSDIVRAPEELEKDLGAVYLPADEVLAQADVVTLHLPYLPENHHYINEDRLSMMKRTAYLVNAARGPIVCEKALVKALRSQQIAGAALDVHEFEPHISEEVASLENVVITPHACTNIAQERINMMCELISGIGQFYGGIRPDNLVNGAVFQIRGA